MKRNNASPSWSTMALLGLVVGLFYLVVPSPKAGFCVSSVKVSIEIKSNGESYFKWVRPSTVESSCGFESDSGDYHIKACDEIEVVVTAQLIACSNSPSTSVSSGRAWGGIRCEEEVDKAVIGSDFSTRTWRVWVENPKQDGYVTFYASATGFIAFQDFEHPENSVCANSTYAVSGTVRFGKAPPLIENACSAGCGGPTQPPAGGGISVFLNGVDFQLHAGKTSRGKNAGYLWLSAQTPTEDLVRPASLQAGGIADGVEVIHGPDGAIRQVKSSQMLVDIVSNSPYGYQLDSYYLSDVGATNGAGLYQTLAPPFVTDYITNADGSTASNRLWITENRSGTVREFRYTYNATNMQWDLLRPEGQTETTWITVDANPSITNEFREVTYDGQVVQKFESTYQYVAAADTRVLLQTIEGDGALTNITTYSYYTNGAASNLIQRIDYPAGNWTYYAYDDYRRKIKEYSTYNNSALPVSGEPDSSTNDFRLVEYQYDDDGLIPYYTAISIAVGGQMHTVSTSFHSQWLGYDQEQQEATPNSEDYLTNTTTISTSENASYGKPLSIVHADGTETTFEYPDDSTTIETDPDGTVTTNVVDELGNPLSRTKIDVATGVVLERNTYAYTNNTGDYYEPLRRSYDLTDLAGRTTRYRYEDCCGVYSITNADLTVTKYDYDLLKRQVASTIYYGGTLGIKTTNYLDALGRVVCTQRIGGTNGTTETLNQQQYDLLGRTIRQTNALGGVTLTTYVIVNNQQCITNTFADGGTRIEIYQRDGRLQSVTGTAVHPVKYAYGIEQDGSGGPWREYTKTITLDANGSETSEWSKTYVDGVGRVYKTIYSDNTPADDTDNPFTQSFYNAYGQLWKQVDADGVATLHQYNDRGELEYTAVDINQNNAIDFDGSDRITRSERTVASASGGKPDLVRQSIFAWTTDGDSSSNLVSTAEASTDGLQTWRTTYRDAGTPVTSKTVIGDAGSTRYVTNTTPDGAYTVSTSLYGRPSSTVQRDAANNQLMSQSYSYDSMGRRNIITDARNGMTTYTYNNADQMTSVTSPNPGDGGTVQTTVNYYNNMLQLTNVLNPDGTSVSSEYFLTGELKRQYGARTYPVEYTYDYAGRMKSMTNWSSYNNGVGSAGARATTWNYNERGFLTNKVYDGGTAGPSYTYTSAGRPATRTWARGIATSYAYDHGGSLTNVSYSDGATASVTNTYDRRGRVVQVRKGNYAASLAYNNADQLLGESYTAGPLVGLFVTNVYDALLRRTNVTVKSGSTVLSSTGYAYDDAGRLATVGDGSVTATYAYVANSPLVGQVTFSSNGVTRMTTSKAYDYLSRLTQITSSPSGAGQVPLEFDYGLNDANQRVKTTGVDGSYWLYEYDSLGQVKSGKKYWSDGTPVAGQQFEYAFDDIGNRKQTRTGGDQNGQNLQTNDYTVTLLNQYTNRTVAGVVDVMGVALVTNSVTVNGQTPYRRGEYFRKELGVANASAPVWQTVTVSAGGSNVTGNVFVPQTPEVFSHDADGNLTQDGRWTYTWDAENRLVAMESDAAAPTASKFRLDFTYDVQGRRIQKIVSTNDGSGYVGEYTNRFVYDGWNLLATLDPQASLLASFAWGEDLSGTLHGAGGVGGLLWVNDAPNSSTHFAAYDGNGNVVALVKAGDGTVSAQYEYGPFGEVIRATGPMAKGNPFRFSTKYQDDETDLVYFGYRYEKDGRWLSRDPIEEDGGENLYSFACNNGIGLIDPIGLKVIRLAFGFDSSARADQETIAFILESVIYLKAKLGECAKKTDCDCPGLKGDFTVVTSYDYVTKNKPKPTDNDYDMNTSDRQLRDDNLGKIKVANYTIRILITRSSIHQTWLGRPTEARANTDKNGTLLAVGIAVSHTIAHEIGHFAGYVGDAPGDTQHAKDVENLMHNPGGDKVDCQWCQKVSALAK